MKESKGPIVFIALFLSGHALVPIFTPDLYPYSAFPMFSDANASCIRRVEVYDQQGASLSGIQIGLFTNYVANPNPKIGCWIGKSEFDKKGTRNKEQLLTDLSQRVCEADYPSLRIVQREFCRVDSQSNGTLNISQNVTETEISPKCE